MSHMHSESHVLRLVELIYDAALDASLWPSFLVALSDAVKGGAANLLYLTDGQGEGAITAIGRGDPDSVRAYAEYYGAQDPWKLRLRAMNAWQAGAVRIGDELVPHAEVKRTEFYNDFAKKYQVVRCIGATFDVDGTVASGVSVNRGDRDHTFEESDRQLLLALCPHLRRALWVDRKISGLKAAEESLDCLALAAIVLAPDGQMLFANQAALRLLGKRDGLSLKSGQLVASSPRESRAVAGLIRAAARPVGGLARETAGVMAVSRPSLRRPYTLTVMRLRGHALARPTRPGHVLVFVHDPEESGQVDEDILRNLYSLTPTESAIASDVAAGSTLQKCARRRGVKESTVRWHFKHVLSKTQTCTQAQLVRLLLASAARVVVPAASGPSTAPSADEA